MSGDIVFTGEGTVTLAGASANDYTGETFVENGASVVLGKENALGETSRLTVSDGSVALGSNRTQVGSLDLQTAGALSGSGTLTILSESASTVRYDNADLHSYIVIGEGEPTTIHAADALGTGSIRLDGTLILSGVAGEGSTAAVFDNALLGDGTLRIEDGSMAALRADNSAFSGQIRISGASAEASAFGDTDVDDILGYESLIALDDEASLTLSQTGSWTIDDAIDGSGSVSVTGGGSDSSFAFSREWGENEASFTGNFTLSNVSMTVAGSGTSHAFSNAANLSSADVTLGRGSRLVVQAGGTTNTFNDLTLTGEPVEFQGLMGFNDASLASLAISGTLHVNADTALSVTLGEGTGDQLAGSVAQSGLLTTDSLNPFQALITATGIDGSGSLGLLVNDGNASAAGSALQNITGAGGADVAIGHYAYEYRQTETQAGIAYELTQVDILDGATLELQGADGADELAVKVTGENGSLAVVSGAVRLTYDGAEGNSYAGATTVRNGASLYAAAGALGSTSDLILEEKATYENAGDNEVGALHAAASSTLILTGDLTINADSAEDQNVIAGFIGGSGDLSFNRGTLTIASTASSVAENAFSGALGIGAPDSTDAATLVVQSLGAVNGASVFTLRNEQSVIRFDLDPAEGETALFASQIAGTGTLYSDADFVFQNEQTLLDAGTGFELEPGGRYDLAAGENASAAEKLLFGVNENSFLVNADGETRNVYGLRLAGGEIDLGRVSAAGGQIHVGEGGLALEEGTSTTISFDTDESTGVRDISDDGHELLSNNEVFQLDLITGVEGNWTDEELNERLELAEDFDQTTETIRQDIDGNSATSDLTDVAVLTRGDGAFHYDAESSAVYLGYNFREINLIYGDDESETLETGLRIGGGDVSGALTAHVTGSGNIDFTGGQISVGDAAAVSLNNYEGRTYVRDGADVTIAADSGFGDTSNLLIEENGSVTLGDGVTQTVHGLTGAGSLLLGDGSVFTLLSGADERFTIANAIASNAAGQGGGSGTFIVDANGQEVSFAGQDLSNIDVRFENGSLRFAAPDASADGTYGALASAESLALGVNAVLNIAAGSEQYLLNDLRLSDEDAAGGSLIFTGVQLTTDGGAAPVLHVGNFEVGATGGSLSAAAEIGDDFDVLANDDTVYQSTLIAFDHSSGTENLSADSTNIARSEVTDENGGIDAYVVWQNNGVETSFNEAGDGSGTISLSFQASELQLADAEGEGLVLNASGAASGAASTLSLKVTDSTNNDGEAVAGNITYAGGNITVTSVGSDYTGRTYVTAGSVTAGASNVFGHTSLLSVSDHASVYLGESGSETVGAVHFEGDGALKGGVGSSLVIGFAGESESSSITGANADYHGTTTLTAGHTLEMKDVQGLGGGAVVISGAEDEASGSDARLILATSASDAPLLLENDLSGSGVVEIGAANDPASIELGGRNVDFSGSFLINGGSTLLAAGNASHAAADHLGSASISFGSAEGTLALKAESGGIDLDNVIQGDGTVLASGAGAESSELRWTSAWSDAEAEGFTGTLALSDIRFAVGADAGAYNAHNFANADAVLQDGSVLVVETGESAVETFGALTLAGGEARFEGAFDFNAGTDELAALHTDSLVIESGNIAVTGFDPDQALAGTVAEENLVLDGQNVFRTLIATDSGITGDISDLTLNGAAGTAAGTKNVTGELAEGGEGTVAVGHYLYGLAADESGRNLGVSFGLSQVDLVDGETLRLTGASSGEAAELSAAITSSGNLEIASGAVHLTNASIDESVESNYTGRTTVAAGASLIAEAGALGRTSWIHVSDGDAELVAAGSNEAGGLTVDEGGRLVVGEGDGASEVVLAIEHADPQAQSSVNGTLEGEGTIALENGTLEVTSSNPAGSGTRFSGTIDVGSAESGAALRITKSDSLGSGAVNLAGAASVFEVAAAGVDATSGASEVIRITNTVSGSGTVLINLENADDLFSFSDEQAADGFVGTIDIEKGGFSLAYAADGVPQDHYTANQNAARDSEVIVGSEGTLYVSTNAHAQNRFYDKTIESLTLAGGSVWFGGLRYNAAAEAADDGGQLVLGGSDGEGGVLALQTGNGETTIRLGEGATNTVSAAGSELLDADDGAAIDLVQNAADVMLDGQSVVGDLTTGSAAVDGALNLALEDGADVQTISQEQADGTGPLEVAQVTRVFGDGSGNDVFGLSGSAEEGYSLHLNYRVDEISLLYGDDADEEDERGLLVTSTAGREQTLGARLTGKGNIVFETAGGSEAGEGVILLGAAAEENDYAGKTFLRGGTVRAASDNVFGQTSLLKVTAGTADLAGHSQSVGALDLQAADALAGQGGTLTIRSEAASTVLYDNADLHSDIVIEEGEPTTIHAADALGTGEIDLQGELIIAGVTGENEAPAVFDNAISGDGELALASDGADASDIALAADNSGFSGSFRVESGSVLHADESLAPGLGIADLLGSGSIALAEGAEAHLSSQGAWTLSNAVSGACDLFISAGGSDHRFDFSADDTTAEFGGRFIFADALLEVGAESSSHTAANLLGNEAVLDEGAVLEVNGSANTGAITLAGGEIRFEEAYVPGEEAYSGQLTTDGDLSLQSGTISLEVAGNVDPAPVDGNHPIQQTDVLSLDSTAQYATVIKTENGKITGNAAGIDLLINGEESRQAQVAIADADGEAVADGLYGFNLQTNEDNTELLLGYGLTEIDIYGGKTLELTGTSGAGDDNRLDAVVADKADGPNAGSGSVAVLGGSVTLANSSNSYTGTTSVAAGAELTALEHAIGGTSSLLLAGADSAAGQAGGRYVNAGDNTAGGVEAEAGSTIVLSEGSELSLNLHSDGFIRGEGALSGAGSLSIAAASNQTLEISSANAAYSGTTRIASGSVEAADIAALGTGAIELNGGALSYALAASDNGYVLANSLVSGEESSGVFAVDAGGSEFAFSNAEDELFYGTVEFRNAEVSLAEADVGNRFALAQANVILGEGSTLHVSDSIVNEDVYDFHDRYVAGLSLAAGSAVSFDGLVYSRSTSQEMGGQLNLEGQALDLSALGGGSKASVSLTEGATNYLTDGSELLDADEGARINIFENASGIIWADGDVNRNLNDYLELSLADDSSTQTLHQRINGADEDPVAVAEVTRTFGTSENPDDVFGYALHAEEGESHTDVYLNYLVEELNLLYVDSDDNGLQISNPQDEPATLSMKITGEGNIVFTGGEILVGNAANDYTGTTIIRGGRVSAATDNAFGETEALVIEGGAQFDLGGRTQTVGRVETEEAGALAGEGSLTIGRTDESESSFIAGANPELSAAVAVTAGHSIDMTDAGGLGTGALALDGSLRIYGTGTQPTEMTNASVSGTGSITAGLAEGGEVETANLLVSHDNSGFSGSWTASGGSTIRFDAGDGSSAANLIGEGATVAANTGGTIELVQAGDADGNLTFENRVSGKGTLRLEAFGDRANLVLGTAQQHFGGSFEFANVELRLDENNAGVVAGRDALLDDGSVMIVESGETDLGTSAITVGGESAIRFEGDLTPGHYGSEEDGSLNAESHLTVGSVTFEENASIQVDPDFAFRPASQPGENVQLTAQDVLSEDEGDLLTILITAENGITTASGGSGSDIELTDFEGNAISSDDQVQAAIYNPDSDPEGEADAVGTYDYALQIGEDRTTLGIAYELKEVSINEGHVLSLSAPEATEQGRLSDNELTAALTGEGGLEISSGHVVLSNSNNDYEGATTVRDDATLTANQGSLGENGLRVGTSEGGTFINAGENSTAFIQAAENSTVTIDAGLELTGAVTDDDGRIVESRIDGVLAGSGSLTLTGGRLRVTQANAGYSGSVSIAEEAVLTLENAAGVGTGGEGNDIAVEGRYELSGVGTDDQPAEAANDFSGSGTIAVIDSSASFTGSNQDFNGAFELDRGSLFVSSAAALGGADVVGIAAASPDEEKNTVHLDFAEDAQLETSFTGELDVEKTGEGAVKLGSFAADGTFRTQAGAADFDSFGDEESESALVVADGASSSVKSGGIFKSLTLEGPGSVFTIGGTAADAAGAAVSVAVRGVASIGSGTLQLGNPAENPTAAQVGNVLETQDLTIDGGTIELNGVLQSGGWTTDRIVVNGTGSGEGSVFVNLLSSSGSVRSDAWLVQAGENGDLSDLDLSLVDDDGDGIGFISAGGYEYRLLEAENGKGYYLHAFNPGTGDISGSDIREPAAGVQASLLMAAQTAFDLSIHDHIGTTLYIDQLTGEKKLTSLWMIQRGDWSEWNDASGQLRTDGKTYTTTIGGDVKSWVTDAGYHVHFGLLGAYANADYDVDSSLDGRKATGKFTGWSVGGYAAFKPAGSDGGFGSVQIRWNRFDNEAGLRGEKTYDYKSDGFSVQGELGYTKTLSVFQTFGGKTGFWRIEPHVRAHWSGVDSDASRDGYGRTYSVDGDGNVLFRAGVRTTLDVTRSTAPMFGDQTVRAFLEANYLRSTKDVSVTTTNEFRTSTVEYGARDMAEFRFGMEAQFNDAFHLWGELHRVTGDDGYETNGAMVGFKYLW